MHPSDVDSRMSSDKRRYSRWPPLQLRHKISHPPQHVPLDSAQSTPHPPPASGNYSYAFNYWIRFVFLECHRNRTHRQYVCFFGLASSLRIVVLRFIQIVCVDSLFLCMVMPRFAYLFACWWTFRLFPFFWWLWTNIIMNICVQFGAKLLM